jgi:hypothetical protein
MHYWDDNIKMDLKGMRYEVVHWIQLTEDEYRWWACEHLMNLLDSIKDGEFLDQLFSKSSLPLRIKRLVGQLGR